MDHFHEIQITFKIKRSRHFNIACSLIKTFFCVFYFFITNSVTRRVLPLALKFSLTVHDYLR